MDFVWNCQSTEEQNPFLFKQSIKVNNTYANMETASLKLEFQFKTWMCHFRGCAIPSETHLFSVFLDFPIFPIKGPCTSQPKGPIWAHGAHGPHGIISLPCGRLGPPDVAHH